MNTPTPEQLEKYRIKRLFKLKGKLFSITKIYGGCYQFLIWKGQGDAKKFYNFESKNHELNTMLQQVPLKSILRVFFELKCTEWNTKWYTTLNAVKCEVCPINEERLKKLARQQNLFEEKEYQKPLKNTFGDGN